MLCKELILGVSEFGPPKNQPGEQRWGGSLAASWEPRTCNNCPGSCPPQPVFSFVKDNDGTRICQRSSLASTPFAGALGAEQSPLQSGVRAQAVSFSNPALTPLFSRIYILFAQGPETSSFIFGVSAPSPFCRPITTVTIVTASLPWLHTNCCGSVAQPTA